MEIMLTRQVQARAMADARLARARGYSVHLTRPEALQRLHGTHAPLLKPSELESPQYKALMERLTTAYLDQFRHTVIAHVALEGPSIEQTRVASERFRLWLRAEITDWLRAGLAWCVGWLWWLLRHKDGWVWQQFRHK